jgi:hypothetical protein
MATTPAVKYNMPPKKITGVATKVCQDVSTGATMKKPAAIQNAM